ncbi:MAG: argininosuccinate lyase [Candidatus Calescibacterium sp.]|nr:argininosuccinate lyase [Candidatus Calescibacterium sp.]MCX7733798.1 argininosuccinate lyase [bacterium]MDW8086996.1 argininosuccinate lyase [Candidatus Calescibacterium sp.]
MEKYLWGGVFSETEKSENIKRFIDSFHFDWIICSENFDITLTHAVALNKLGILEKDAIVKIFESKQKVIKSIQEAQKDEFEDVHSAIEFFISKFVGEDVGFNLRLGRSRNEEVISSTNLWILRKFLNLKDMFKKISDSVISSAEKNFGKVVPLFTHTRQAQPILFSHLVLSYHEGFIRCLERISDCLERFDVCHLGSGAGAGTGVPLDVEFMAQMLGFSKISQNSIDSTGRRDNITELIFNFAILSELFSKIADDLILLSSENFGFVELSDKLCTGSSMMPQKKNPDTLEVTRSKFPKLTGYLNSMLMLEKGLISGYSKDLQEDKRILFSALHEIFEVCEIIPEVFLNMKATEGNIHNYTLATDLAEKIVQDKKITYREAHKLVGEKLKKGEKIKDITIEESLRLKRTPQSTNPNLVKNQIENHKKRSDQILGEIERFLKRFEEADFRKRIEDYLRNI